MPPYYLHKRAADDNDARDESSSHDNLAKNVAILIGCIFAISVLFVVIGKVFGYRICLCRGRRRNNDSEGSSTGVRHLDAAQVMRLCAQRFRNPPPLPPVKTTEKTVPPTELDAVAPEMTFRCAVQERYDEKDDGLVVVELAVPQAAVVADKDWSTPRSSTTSKSEIPDDRVWCSICLDGYTVDTRVRKTVCGHIFHTKCASRWLTTRRSRCPLCLKDLAKSEESESFVSTEQESVAST